MYQSTCVLMHKKGHLRLKFLLVLNKDRYRNKDCTCIVIFSQLRNISGFQRELDVLPIMKPETIGVLYVSFKKHSQWVVI